MRTAPIARQMRQYRLIRAYEIYRVGLGRREAAMDRLLGGLGHRRPYPPGWDATAELLTGDDARHLADADL
jgi:hypothetical protein